MNYLSLKISEEQAEQIAKDSYGVEGSAIALPGESDFNFKIETAVETYILKVSRPEEDAYHLEFQQELLFYINNRDLELAAPKIISDSSGNFISKFTDGAGIERNVRLLSWTEGRLWSSINPINDKLLYSLGEEAGKLTSALEGFDHVMAHREFVWDIAQAEWTFDQTNLFSEKQQKIVSYFHQRFKSFQKTYRHLRKGIVHNDVNDNNVIVNNDLVNPKVKAIIDYGDAIHTAVINDVAITTAYAIMQKPDVLAASLPLVQGYHSQFPFQEKELRFLYDLIAIRLIVSVTKSAINKLREPDNEYLLISEKPAWEVLEKWFEIDANLAWYSFRSTCGFIPVPMELHFSSWQKDKTFL